MTTSPLSNANSSYLNAILYNKTPNPSAMQNSQVQTQTQANTTTQTKEKSDSFSKVLLCLAAGGTILIQAIALTRKPSEANSDETKLINENINTLKKAVDELRKQSQSAKPAQVDTSKLQDVIDGFSSLSEQIEKISGKCEATSKAVKEISKVSKEIEALKKALSAQSNQDLSSLQGVLEKLSAEISGLKSLKSDIVTEISDKIASNQTSSADMKKISDFAVQIDSILKELDKIAKMQTADGQEVKALQTTLEKLNKEATILKTLKADIVSELAQKFALLQTSGSEAKAISSLEEMCREISSRQTRDTSKLEEKFDELIDIFNMFLGSKKVPIEQIEFKSKVPYIKGENEVFNGIITKQLKDGTSFEIMYVNGKLAQSKKLDSMGNEIGRKTYNNVLTRLQDGNFIQESSVTISDGSPIFRKINFEKITTPNAEVVMSKNSSKVIDTENQTAKDVHFFVRSGSVAKMRRVDGDKKTEKIFKFEPVLNEEKIKIKEKSVLLRENQDAQFNIEVKPPEAKDPYTYYAIV